jgi:hypothetical protein
MDGGSPAHRQPTPIFFLVSRFPVSQLALLSTFSVPFRLDLASSLFGGSYCVFVSCFPTGPGEQCENNGAFQAVWLHAVPEDTARGRTCKTRKQLGRHSPGCTVQE